MRELIYTFIFVLVSHVMFGQTLLIKDIDPGSGDSNPKRMVNVNGTIFFSADSADVGEALWATDGTTSGTYMVKDIRTGGNGAPANITRLLPIGNKVFFRANDDSNGKEPWISDGTELGTSMIMDIAAGSASSNPNNYVNNAGTIYFLAYDGNGGELWTSDGTVGNASMVKDINPSGNSNPQNLVVFNSEVYFSADDGSSGFELWRSNGTSGGTNRVIDINSGASGSLPKFLTDVNGTLFFQADDGVNGIQLWTSDGTEGGTSLVTNINPGGSSFIRYITDLNGSAVFQANDGSNGEELWISDGTAGGTSMLLDINSGAGSSSPQNLIVAGGILYFTADDGVTGIELWRTDGTTVGTYQVADINPGVSASNPTNLTNANGALYFSATDGTNGVELWKTDGTAEGTVMVDDINAGSGDSNPTDFAVKDGIVYFGAYDATNGNELRSTSLVQATNLQVTGSGPGTIDLSWTNGSGTRRIVVAREGGATYSEPVDGTEYVAGPFSNGSNIGGAQYVVYDGAGESTTVTGLDFTTTYYFTVFEYIGSGSEIDYIVVNKENVSGVSGGESEPTAIASNMSFGSITETSFQVSWSNTGDGARRIVVAREGAEVTKVPVDGVTYVSNNVFAGGGANLGGGQYVVYDGTGSSFVLSGLNNATTYHLAVFEYNGTGGNENYLDTQSLKGSQATATPIEPEPTLIASNMTFSEIGQTSFRVTWDNTGDGDGRIVVARKGATVTKVPADGVVYNANSKFAGGGSNLGGEQYVVYKGTGNTFVLSGLEINTVYHLAVYEYNVSIPGTENYLTSTSLKSSQATAGVSEPTLIASDIIFSSITSSTMDVSWNNTGNGERRLVVARKNAAVTKYPTDGVTYASSNTFAGGGSNLGGAQYVVYDGTGNSFTLSGLEASTTYHLAVYEYNGVPGQENYLIPQALTGSATTSVFGGGRMLASGEENVETEFESEEINLENNFNLVGAFGDYKLVFQNTEIAASVVQIYTIQGQLVFEKDNTTSQDLELPIYSNDFGKARTLIVRIVNKYGIKTKTYYIN